jgi:polysaccharide export outer membrane protein
MPERCLARRLIALGALFGIGFATFGCQFSVNFGDQPTAGAPPLPAPKEGCKVAQVAYVIEPPDLLTVELFKSLPDRPLTGERLVRTDGTIDLGFYGSVCVAGLTIDQARERVEQYLSATIRSPKVHLDVYSYNSKGYYVVADGAGFGEQTVRLPFTGNETVLDAIAQIGGLPPVSSKTRIWLSRPGCGVMPINWNAIVQCGDPSTNYQMQPNDRIYINSDPLLRFDTCVGKLVNPWERIFGFTLLGASTIKVLQNMGRGTNGTGGVF